MFAMNGSASPFHHKGKPEEDYPRSYQSSEDLGQAYKADDSKFGILLLLWQLGLHEPTM